MNKKGFTLVEVMGVIAILAIIVTIAIPVYKNTVERQKIKTYENKVSLIELKAEQWATETNLKNNTTITVKKLMTTGYIQGDTGANEGDVINPIDESSMLCYKIDIELENGVPKASIKGSEYQDCELSESESEDANIKIKAYEYESEINKVGKELKVENNEIEWTKEAVLLQVESEEYKDYTEVLWGYNGETEAKEAKGKIIKEIRENSNIKEEDYANIKVVDAAVFLRTDYQVSLRTEEGLKSREVEVKIDKEAPTIVIINNEEYTNEEKEITIRGTDGAGSGLKGFYVSDSQTDPKDNFIATKYETEITKSVGNYYVYAVDEVGNISKEPTDLNVSNIDSSKPSCKIEIINGTKGKNEWYTSNVTVRMTTSIAGPTGLSYGFGTRTKAYYSDGYIEEGEKGTKEIVLSEDKVHNLYCYVTNSLNVTGKNSKEIKVDRAKPSMSAKKSPLTLGNVDYTFTDNVNIVYGPSGKESLVCNPARSKKTGTYNVTCTAYSNNGLTSTLTFQVKHSYPATYNRKTCTTSFVCNCETRQDCDSWCCSTASFGCSNCCTGYCFGGDCTTYEVCETCTRTYDCSYYTCPQGGSLSGSTCYY